MYFYKTTPPQLYVTHWFLSVAVISIISTLLWVCMHIFVIKETEANENAIESWHIRLIGIEFWHIALLAVVNCVVSVMQVIVYLWATNLNADVVDHNQSAGVSAWHILGRVTVFTFCAIIIERRSGGFAIWYSISCLPGRCFWKINSDCSIRWHRVCVFDNPFVSWINIQTSASSTFRHLFGLP